MCCVVSRVSDLTQCVFCCTTGVFGTLELYGQPPNVYHTKLAANANAGSNTLTLAQSVDWQVSFFTFNLCSCTEM